jgi:hypothetical protein
VTSVPANFPQRVERKIHPFYQCAHFFKLVPQS